MSERAVMNDVIRAFGTRPDMRIWRANVGAAMFQGRKVQFGVPGQADLTGVLPVTCPHCQQFTVGARLEIETKSATGRQRSEQAAYAELIRRFGGLYVLARSAADVETAIEVYRGTTR